ncbi:MAG: ribose 5-phosphate isomerase B [Chloroflexota bacterium]
MKIAIGADHHGLDLKKHLTDYIQSRGHAVTDLGAHDHDPDDDYPDITVPVAKAVATGQADRGIVICGSGVGACIAANKIPGARAAVCHDPYSAQQGVEHDDMNVLCLGSRIIGTALAERLIDGYLEARLDKHPRFQRRLEKVKKLENEAMRGEPKPC